MAETPVAEKARGWISAHSAEDWARSIRPQLTRSVLIGGLGALIAARVYVIISTTRLLRGPSGAGFGADFGMFVGAAKVFSLGGNPYDHALLYRTERAFMHAQHLLITGHIGIVRVGYPILLYWALQPVTHLAYQPVALIWIGSMWVLAGVGAATIVRSLGWRRSLPISLIFALTPQVLTGVVVGNIVPVVFAVLAIGLWLINRHPTAAGVVLAGVWLKPQIGVPSALLMLAFQARSPRRVLAGFLGASTALVGLTLLVAGWHSFPEWLHGLTGYSQSIAAQMYVTSLAGMYYQWAPSDLRLMLGAVTLLAALAATWIAWRRYPRERPLPLDRVAWLWFVWFLAGPYAHIDDEMILAIPLLTVLGRDGKRLSHPAAAFAVFLMLISTAREPAWLPWELLAGAIILLMPDASFGRSWGFGWRAFLFGLLLVASLSWWGSHKIDMESLDLVGAAVCVALLARSSRFRSADNGVAFSVNANEALQARVRAPG